jgi:hypothetical protein
MRLPARFSMRVSVALAVVIFSAIHGNVYGAEGPISRPVAGGGITKYVKQ